MLKWILLVALILYTYLEVAHFASFLPRRQADGSLLEHQMQVHRAPPNQDTDSIDSTTTAAQYNSTSSTSTVQPGNSNTQPSTWHGTSETGSSDISTSLATLPPDPNSDLEDASASSTPASGSPDAGQVTLSPNSNRDPDGKTANNKSKPQTDGGGHSTSHASIELSVLFYSIFIVYVSFIKLVYHNVALIRRNLTEPGILMIFGIIWELVVRQLTDNYGSSPRFNSRIFFYLFLPSTVLESASLLSNKWLFLNLLPILVHSILGTLFYASCLGFSIYALNNQNVFNMAAQRDHSSAVLSGWQQFSYLVEPGEGGQSMAISASNRTADLTGGQGWPPEVASPSTLTPATNKNSKNIYDKGLLTSASTATSLELSNLTLADCLVFGTILSSIDSTIVLEVFRQVQVNNKLYYLVLGENLMNNAVVIVIFDLLLDFFNETRITVVKIYIAITQFFVTLFGSIFIGLLLAGVALISIRLSKRLQLPRPYYSYQCQAMVETLLILKLAYLTYTLASLAGTSSIVSLATFGILQDQYIKHNLNLRSQLTFKQVILASKTLGYSLVYPLLGMLLVEVANTSHFFQAWLSFDPDSVNSSNVGGLNDGQAGNYTGLGATANMFTAASVAASKLSLLASQANLHWNFKFLSLVTLLTVAIRFVVVLALGVFCNLFSSSQLRIKFKEQVLLAYGGLKGPLAFALVNRLVEHEESRDRTLRNKHIFMYTILFITFVSTLIKGSLMRPLVCKIQPISSGSLSTSSDVTADTTTAANAKIVFDEINSKVADYVTQGLNSVLGHTKSPYDRFVELNETHIKPWLARRDSNTNWLSVFYDNLILDETLNANCFYKSTETDPAMQHYWQQSKTTGNKSTAARRAAGQSRPQRGAHKLPTSSNPLLVTIDESNPTSIKRSGSSLTPKQPGVGASGSRVPLPPTQSHKRGANVPESSVLKELVMYNLKVEDARMRRRRDWPAASQPRNHHSWNKVEPISSSCDEDFVAIQRQRNARMLSTTDSSGDVAIGMAQLGSSNPTTLDKNRHLAEVERKLVASGPELVNPLKLALEAHQQLPGADPDHPNKKAGTSTANLSKLRILNQPNKELPASPETTAPAQIKVSTATKIARAKQAAGKVRDRQILGNNNRRTRRRQRP